LNVITISYTKPRVEFADKDGRKHTFKFEKSKTHIGRSSMNELRLYDKSISRQHARIDLINNSTAAVLVDLGSSTGCKVNDTLITQKLLQPGDRILLGRVEMQFLAN